MTPQKRERLRQKACRSAALADRCEQSASTLLKKAAYHRGVAYQHRQAADGQLALALNPHRAQPRLLLKHRAFLQMLRDANRTHSAFAAQLGIAKSTWSQLVNGKRGVTPQMQARLRNHPLLKGRPETALWEPEP
jgi:transcriptional regulator with XRE-family HTH domain